MMKTGCIHSRIAPSEDEKEQYPLLGTNLHCASVCLVSGLGQGGFGSVYLAQECRGRSNNEVALATTTTKLFAAKIVDTRNRDVTYLLYLRRKHKLHAKVASHPNIIQIYSIHETPDNTIVLLDYAKDGDVFSLLENHSRAISRNNTLLKLIFLQVLDAVVHIHKHSVFHCDIKPDNLLLKQEGNVVRVLLSDFNCGTDKPIIYDDNGLYSGTSSYLPPECLPQAKSIYALPGATDTWSLGVFLYIICSGGLFPWDEASLYNRRYRSYLNDPVVFFSKLSLSPAAEDILKEFWIIDLWERERIGVKNLRERIELIDEFTAYPDSFSGLQENYEQPLLSSAAWQRGRRIKDVEAQKHPPKQSRKQSEYRYSKKDIYLDSETQEAALVALALLSELEISIDAS